MPATSPFHVGETQIQARLGVREAVAVFPLLVLIVWIGVLPMTFLSPLEAAVNLALSR